MTKPANHSTATDRIQDEPLFVVDVNIRGFDLNGWIVVHSVGAEGSCGGLRLYPDVTREEVKNLARAMTFKYSFFEKNLGGAKAGLQVPFDLTPEDRREVLRRFGANVAHLMRSGIYVWTDMNSSATDIGWMLEGANIRWRAQGDSSYYTALSTFAGVRACAEHYGLTPSKCTVTIEGVGNVGSQLAREIDQWGGKVVGASTRCGAVANISGIDVEEMLKCQRSFGHEWVQKRGKWDRIAKEDIFSLPVAIHVPCARVHSLTKAVAEAIKARAVVPAANVPCTPSGEEALLARGITLLPDFVVNCGGIIGTGMGARGVPEFVVRRVFLDDLKQLFIRLLAFSEKTGEPPLALAREESHLQYVRLNQNSYSKSGEIYKKFARLGLVPTAYDRRRSVKRLIGVISNKFR